MNEQQATEKLEQMVGVSACFHLMRLWTAAEQTVSGDRYDFSRIGKERRPAEVFVDRARRERYADNVIAHYVQNIQGAALPKGFKKTRTLTRKET